MANADGLDHMLNRVMPKDNIGLAALLQTTEAAWENSTFFPPFTFFFVFFDDVFLFFSTLRRPFRATTDSGVYGPYSLGSGILRCEIDPDDDAQ